MQVHEILVKLAGSTSFTSTPKTSLGPLFLTTIVYVVGRPGTIVLVLLVFVIDRSLFVEQKGMSRTTLDVVPAAPRVAPLAGNSVSDEAVVIPFTPPLTSVEMLPPEKATKPPPPPPPGPSDSGSNGAIGCDWFPPLPPLASAVMPLRF